jgi:hypothetical protein
MTNHAIVIRPVTRTVARKAVLEWHSHHDPHVVDRLCLGAFVGELVAVAVLASPVAGPLDDGETWELTRVAVGPAAPPHTCSRLVGAATRVGLAAGVTRLVSYTRVDERGACYRAANWRPVAVVSGRRHDRGNRALRWLPGLYEPSTEIVDRVRWEIGPRAGAAAAEWDGARWRKQEAA